MLIWRDATIKLKVDAGAVLVRAAVLEGFVAVHKQVDRLVSGTPLNKGTVFSKPERWQITDVYHSATLAVQFSNYRVARETAERVALYWFRDLPMEIWRGEHQGQPGRAVDQVNAILQAGLLGDWKPFKFQGRSAAQ